MALSKHPTPGSTTTAIEDAWRRLLNRPLDRASRPHLASWCETLYQKSVQFASDIEMCADGLCTMYLLAIGGEAAPVQHAADPQDDLLLLASPHHLHTDFC